MSLGTARIGSQGFLCSCKVSGIGPSVHMLCCCAKEPPVNVWGSLLCSLPGLGEIPLISCSSTSPPLWSLILFLLRNTDPNHARDMASCIPAAALMTRGILWNISSKKILKLTHVVSTIATSTSRNQTLDRYGYILRNLEKSSDLGGVKPITHTADNSREQYYMIEHCKYGETHLSKVTTRWAPRLKKNFSNT